MKCMNHAEVEATGACRECGNFFCNSCLMKVGNKNLCHKCAAELLEKQNAPAPAQPAAQVVVVQQQQQQQQQPAGVVMFDPRRGSTGWLIFWIIFFWPIAIVYYLTRIRP